MRTGPGDRQDIKDVPAGFCTPRYVRCTLAGLQPLCSLEISVFFYQSFQPSAYIPSECFQSIGAIPETSMTLVVCGKEQYAWKTKGREKGWMILAFTGLQVKSFSHWHKEQLKLTCSKQETNSPFSELAGLILLQPSRCICIELSYLAVLSVLLLQ